jgi:hypothetical protein
MNRSTLSRLFYIYSELSVAVFLAFGVLIELLCGALLMHWGVDSIAYLAFGGAIFFTLTASSLVYSVYKSEKRG